MNQPIMRLMGCISRTETPTVPSMPVRCDVCGALLWMSIPMHSRGDITPLCMPCLRQSVVANPRSHIGGVLPESRNSMIARGWTPQQINAAVKTIKSVIRQARTTNPTNQGE